VTAAVQRELALASLIGSVADKVDELVVDPGNSVGLTGELTRLLEAVLGLTGDHDRRLWQLVQALLAQE